MNARPTDNARLARRLTIAAVAMVAFGFLLVPLYRVYCEITGVNDTRARRIGASDAAAQPIDASRWVTVEFVATTSGTLPWEFRPETPRLRVHPGDLVLTRFHTHNIGNRAIVGQAIPTVAPGAAIAHFHKLECFCFRNQPLAPGESKDLPLQFQIDPRLPANVSTVTLAYAFFETPESALAAPTAKRGAMGPP